MEWPEARYTVASQWTPVGQLHPSGQVQLPKTGCEAGLHVAGLVQKDIENTELAELE